MTEQTKKMIKAFKVEYVAGEDRKTESAALQTIADINSCIESGDIGAAERMVNGARGAMNVPFRIEFEANEHMIIGM